MRFPALETVVGLVNHLRGNGAAQDARGGDAANQLRRDLGAADAAVELVHVDVGLLPHEIAGEGRRVRRSHRGDDNLPAIHLPEPLRQRGQIEVVPEARAPRFHDDREVRVLRDDGQDVPRPEAVEP